MSTNVETTTFTRAGHLRRQPTPNRNNNGRRGRPYRRYTVRRLIREASLKGRKQNLLNNGARLAKQVNNNRFLKRTVERLNPVYRLTVTSPSINQDTMLQLTDNRNSRTFNKLRTKILQIKHGRMCINKRRGLVTHMVMSMPMVLNASSSQITFLRFIRITGQLSMTVAVTDCNGITSLAERLNILVISRAIPIRLLRHNTLRRITIPLEAGAESMRLYSRVTVHQFFKLSQQVTFLHLNRLSVATIITKIKPVRKLHNLVLNLFNFRTNPPRLPSSVRHTCHDNNRRRFHGSTRRLPRYTTPQDK